MTTSQPSIQLPLDLDLNPSLVLHKTQHDDGRPPASTAPTKKRRPSPASRASGRTTATSSSLIRARDDTGRRMGRRVPGRLHARISRERPPLISDRPCTLWDGVEIRDRCGGAAGAAGTCVFGFPAAGAFTRSRGL
ncbi:Uu.00g050780.m01.CDS01 [Anthostomella pinea]|uniref:Uu.00g050780.m01.CDS01 n=1 Tax=Anthostomella pinea TaxID=933095 RepID=A0AAI8VM49_9PEZI|nr:Uu.00g050780.m01.CDS01 [Anthostomella pinea]